MKKILVLYTELADYMLNAYDYYSNNFDTKFYIIHWDQNKEAPFQFKSSENINLINKNSINRNEILDLYSKEQFDLIISSGWLDKDYMAVLKKIKRKTPTILTLDNHYNGSIKQRILCLSSPFFLKKIFSHVWVPGIQQEKYAKKLSFKEEEILKGLYVANKDNFKNNYKVKRNFVYIGRYIEYKGVKELFETFIKFNKISKHNWKLTSIGTGDLWNDKLEDPNIEHIGFVQPKDILNKLEGGVFVLPSHFEPWGVVVHEMCIAGYPLILSDKVGSASAFLDSNGFSFKSKNSQSLLEAMMKFDKLDDEEIYALSKRSKELAANISLEKWSEQLNQILK